MNVKRLSGLSVAVLLAASAGTTQAASDAEIAGMATGGAPASASAAPASKRELAAQLKALQEQVQAVNRFVDRFQSDAASQYGAGFNALEWKREFGARLMYESTATLTSASSARDLTAAQGELARVASAAKHASDNGNTVNFLPSPCRIVDTRLGGGGMLGPAFRFWYAYNTPAVIAGQGGNAAGCGSFPGANLWFLYVTVVPPGAPLSGGANFLTVQHDATGPTTSTMNYYPGVNIANFAITSNFDGASTGGFNAFASSPTHVVIDLIGWGGTLGPDPLATANQTNSITVLNASSNELCTTACPAGYTLTGGACDWGSAGGFNKSITESGPFRAPGSNGWCCGGFNNVGATRTLNATAFCARVPGL